MPPRSRAIDEALHRYRPGWSLEQFFYVDPELFEYECRTWLARQWYLVGHSSEVPATGCYIVREVLGESVIVVRAADGLRGFFNVCRHRGSRLCQHDGTAALLTCPYHAWSYALDGGLRTAAALPDDIDKSQLALRPVQLRDIGGLLFCALDPAPTSLEATAALLPALEYQGIPCARIAARRQYGTAANWKLVMENFHECYHCLPAHPQYSAMMRHVKRYAMDAPAQAAEWDREVHAWTHSEAIADFPNAAIESADAEWSYAGVTRFPVGAGRKTQSEDGKPVAPLMGRYPHYDGGVANFSAPPFVFFFGLNDHAVLFHFLPRAAEYTDVTVTWLVDGAAAPDAVDIDRMVWLWDVTTRQDKALIETNAAGIHSRAYAPGPYSKLEQWAIPLITEYIDELRAQAP
ncbi:MAG: aromatic ring-hydroxylating dioxygenase subunit alpha [Pseudomonadota bacterium]|nr:aromatic ring-hydroxylating dioxygenase subunit alpha [Pseudomonadota bacterium]